MNQGSTVFSQLGALLPRRAFDNAVAQYRGDRRIRSLSCMDQLLCMLFPQITNRSSLRETISCLEALGTRRYHMGIRTEVARSTLAEANERRNYRIFEDTALAMIAEARIEVPLDAELRDFGAEIYALDSTTIDLSLKLFPWAHFRKQKAGIKAYTLLDVRTDVPVFIRITHSKTHDLHALGQIQPQSLAY